MGKLDRLKHQINILSPSIVCVVESWLSEPIPTIALNSPSYNCFRLDCKSANPSGGLLLYIKRSLSSSVVNTDVLALCEGSEFLCVDIQLKHNKKFLLGTIYNHPPINLQIFNIIAVIAIIEFLLAKNKDFYLLGGFNVNVLDVKNNLAPKFNAFLKRTKVTQCVTFPTRVCTTELGTSSTLIDLLVSNSPHNVHKIEENMNERMSDHKDLLISLNLNVPKSKKRYTRTFREMSKYSRNDFLAPLILKTLKPPQIFSIYVFYRF